MKRFTPAAVDCHQHRWPAAVVEELRRRTAAPRLEGWTLHLAGEPPYPVDPTAHDAGARAALDEEDGVALVLNALSAPLGIECLPPEEAEPLLAAWHAYADRVDPQRERIWAAPGLGAPDPDGLADVLAGPAVCGLQVPATAMATPRSLDRLAPLLAVAEAADKPVLVHPGAAPATPESLPGWWPAVVSYPAQQAAAWHAWRVAGRSLLPRLRVGFVGLAGLGPLHHERMAHRGAGSALLDPGVFYETSSYGRQAIDAVTRAVGVDSLIHGSDRPYAVAEDPQLGAAFTRLWRVTNPHRFLNGGTP